MEPMQHDDFIQLVYDMRQHQKAYFATRSQIEYNTARSYERRVDAALADYSAQSR